MTVATSIDAQLEEAIAVAATAPPEVAADAVALARHLYGAWYAAPRRAVDTPTHRPPRLTEMLRGAHASTDRWEDGWRVERTGPGGQIVARRGAAVRLLARTDYAAVDRPGLQPAAGDAVAVTARRDLVDPTDGWWRTGGAAWSWTAPPARGLVRLYFDHPITSLPALVRGVTERLAHEPEPWLLKCAVEPEVHVRPDASVVYLTPAALARHAEALVALGPLESLGPLGPLVPPLTLEIAPGVGAAVDPGGEDSFGGHRCRLIAEALTGPQGRTLSAIHDRFDQDGVDPTQPWRRRHDQDLPWTP